jgi:predicted Zn-dependent protease
MRFWRAALFLLLFVAYLSAGRGTFAQSQSLKFPHAADINAIGKRDLAKTSNFYSPDKEKALGKQLAQEVERSSRMVNDPDVNAYLDALAQKLAKHSDAKMPIAVRVIESKLVDATTLPGGFLFVNSALILEAKSEGELAGAIAHGIAHTAMRSGTGEVSKDDIMQLAWIPTMVFIPYSWAGWGIYQGQNLAIPLIAMKTHGQYTLAADYFALQYLYVSGYDLDEFVALLERMGQKNSGIKNVYVEKGWYRSWSERAERLRKEIADILPSREAAIHSTSEFDDVKEKIRLWKPDSTRPVLRTKGG